MKHAGKRLFIAGIPTAGKSYLAEKLANAVGGIAVLFDDFREILEEEGKYKKWARFYLDQDEKEYLINTSADDKWKNLVLQSEALWPAFLEEIDKYKDETKPVIFECVNLLPRLVRKDLDFPGIVLVGKSLEETLRRNKLEPRWGNTEELQVLEAKMFFEEERPHYIQEAKDNNLPVFESADDVFETALNLLK